MYIQRTCMYRLIQDNSADVITMGCKVDDFLCRTSGITTLNRCVSLLLFVPLIWVAPHMLGRFRLLPAVMKRLKLHEKRGIGPIDQIIWLCMTV